MLLSVFNDRRLHLRQESSPATFSQRYSFLDCHLSDIIERESFGSICRDRIFLPLLYEFIDRVLYSCRQRPLSVRGLGSPCRKVLIPQSGCHKSQVIWCRGCEIHQAGSETYGRRYSTAKTDDRSMAKMVGRLDCDLRHSVGPPESSGLAIKKVVAVSSISTLRRV